MIAVIAAVIGMTVIGLPIALATAREARAGALVGLAFLYGSGAVYVVMLLLPWRLPLIVLALLAISAVGWWLARSRSRVVEAAAPAPSPALRAISATVDVATAVTLAGYALFITVAPPWEWDFWAIWGLKARVFFEHGGIDWRFLESRWNDFAHSEYPQLVPFQFDFLALLSGGWNDRWFGVLFLAYGLALVLIVRELTARELPAPFPALIAFVMAGLACSRYAGLAEGPLIAFGTAAILFLRIGERLPAALLFGLAASTKQEGVALLIATVVVLFLSRRWRDALRLWPALLLAAPWPVLASAHSLRSYLATPGVLDRVAARLARLGEYVALLVEWTPDAWVWLVILLAILVARAADRATEAPYILIVILQAGAILFAYVTTPFDVSWHIVTSWPRLERQILPLAAWLALVLLAKTFLREKNLAHAEARSDL